MNTSHSRRRGPLWSVPFEALESRRLFAITLPTTPLPPSAPPTPVSTISTTAVGHAIHAEANQAFTAVIGVLPPSIKFPASYTLHGSITWGDGTGSSDATFLREPNGAIDVVGSHTYANAGRDVIKAVITAVPPPGSLAPVLVLGQIRTTADVVASPGGVTIQATEGVEFTAAVAFFNSNLSSLNMKAIIRWGDGTTSIGKILALPTAGPVGRFEVVGTHTYAMSHSYPVNVVVVASPATPISGGPTPTFIVLVADVDSVVDVLPVGPTPVT